jgi:hypothetical protein
MTAQINEPRTYSYWGPIQSAGIFGLGFAGSIFLLVGLFGTVIITQFTNFLFGIAFFTPFVVICWLIARKDKHGRSALDRGAAFAEFKMARFQGLTLYRSGPAGMLPSGRNELPGLAAKSRLYESSDSYARRFAIIHHPSPGHVVVAFACDPEGGALVDPHQVDSWVAGLDQFLTSLGEEQDIVAAAIGIETAPDTGAKLRRNIIANIDPNAHPTSLAIVNEILVTYPTGGAIVSGFVTITVAMTTGYGHKRSIDEIATELGARIPRWAGLLSVTGAGAIRPMRGQELVEVIRVAYDPKAASLIEDTYSEGHIPEIDWADVGPVGYDAEQTYMRHEEAYSVTWQMTGAPTGVVRSNIFERFLAPHPDIPRKRVTMLYRPIEQSRLDLVAKQDANTGGFLSGSFRGSVEAANAITRAHQVANGHGLVNFGLIASVTVPTIEHLPAAENALESLGGAARLRLRIATAQQHTAFAAGLPLGLVLPLHLKTPKAAKRKRNR